MEQTVYSYMTVKECLAALRVDEAVGLDEWEISKRILESGKNELPKPKRRSIWLLFFHQFSSPLIWFLLIATLIAGYLGEWIQVSAIGLIILVNAWIGFFQEFSAERSFDALKSLHVPKSKVLRNGRIQKIPSSQIVPGDLVLLEAGDHVPADGRIIYEAQLAIQEAVLTGESAPVYKQTEPIEDTQLADQKNMTFFGTHVLKGKGKIVVTQTGLNTELGKIAAHLQTEEKKLTPLQIRFQKLSKQLAIICFGVLILISVLGIWKNMGWIELALTSLSLAVAAIPEGLPTIVTIALAAGVKKLFKQKALIRKLASVETLGCTSVICADKTGTITKNEMVVLHYWIGGDRYDVSGAGYEPKGHFTFEEKSFDLGAKPELLLALRTGCLCNDAILIQTQNGWEIIGDPTEGALLTSAGKGGLWKSELEKETPLRAEIPFDSERKRMTVLRSDGVLYMKGAVESVESCCNRCIWQGAETKLDRDRRQAIFEAHDHFSRQGYRVLALAQKKQTSRDPSISTDVETGFLFLGLVAMIDPPRPEVKEAIQTCRKAKIIPVMITGDHKQTASTIAKQIGLVDPERSLVIDGVEMDQMSDAELKRAVLKTAVFARVTAPHKLRIVQAWKSHGHIVAMTGDGVNDTLAMKKADIGIAMGIAGTEITKQMSDMVILDDHFATIVAAIQEGRGIYNNIIKFVHLLLSANFGELLLIIFGMLWQFSSSSGEIWAILLPSQILWINLITDGGPAIALGFDPVEKSTMLRAPRKLSEPILSLGWTLRLIAISCLIALGSIAAAHFGAKTSQQLSQTMAFTELVVLELVILFFLRLPLSPISNKGLLIAVGASLSLQLAVLYFPPIQPLFGTTFLMLGDWLRILAITSVVSLATLFAIKSKRIP